VTYHQIRLTFDYRWIQPIMGRFSNIEMLIDWVRSHNLFIFVDACLSQVLAFVHSRHVHVLILAGGSADLICVLASLG